MEPQDQQPAGDYGYDLAHEEPHRAKGPEAAAPPPEQRRTSAGRPPDLEQDYGYDEAHGF
jgi:hypothetical protein